MRLSLGAAALSLLSTLMFLSSIFGQDLDNVTFSGRVTDPNGAPIPGATVTVTHIDTNARRTVTSNEQGSFRIVNLQPGGYKILVSAKGFGIKELSVADTVSGQVVQNDFQLA